MTVLSGQNRKLRQQFSTGHQHWTMENWKTIAWSDEFQFLLNYSDGRVRILHTQHDSRDPSCLVSMMSVSQAGGGGIVWGIPQ